MPAGIRPTQNIVRKAVFDIIGHDMSGLGFLELFAGSGAVGFEALSRGARRVVFVDKDPKCHEVITRNLELLGVLESGEMPREAAPAAAYQIDAFQAVKQLARRGERFEIVFADPPYERGGAKKMLKTLGGYDILQPNAVIIIQHEKGEILPEEEGRFSLLRRRRYGPSVLSVYGSASP